MPKIIAVAVYFGAIVTVTGLWFTCRHLNTPLAHDQLSALIKLISFVLRFIAVPAMLVAIVFGILLTLQHAHTFTRLRWWRIKLVSIAIAVPAAHFYLSGRLAVLRGAVEDQTAAPDAERQFGIGLLAVVVTFIWIIALGRLKPRLRQNWSRTFRSNQPSNAHSTPTPKPHE